ncbi:MAG TPA: T9SS type A sorting domain-containing protein [Chitinophagales bacterium]|nr:T9SS type A sorting domain-containing protein [Chitinophagales bacterium]
MLQYPNPKNHTLVLLFILWATGINGQASLVKQWDYRFGGTSIDRFERIIETVDSGYLLAGSSNSDISGDKTQNSRGNYDFWVVKLNKQGVMQWDKRFGGLEDDILTSVFQTTDSGYILGGTSLSGIGGDKTAANNSSFSDYWIVKIDASGNKLWDKTLGGYSGDELNCVIQLSDGGYLLGGYSFSDVGGDKTEPNRGNPSNTTDYWIIKTDSAGNKKWDKRFGGTSTDRLTTLIETYNGDYLLAGYSGSGANGDKSQSNWSGADDFWVIKVDTAGLRIWDKRFGGTGYERINSVKQTGDGGFILAGYSESDSSGDKTETNRGTALSTADYWMIKIDSTGNKQWDKRYGGTLNESIKNIVTTRDGGYFLSGYSYSAASPDKSQNNLGTAQSWIIKTDSNGSLEWEKTILEAFQSSNGVSSHGYGLEIKDGCYLIGNATGAGISGEKTQPNWGNFNSSDYWIIKYCDSSIAAANFQVTLAGTSVCQEICNGTARANVSYGIPPYRYAWSNNDTISIINNLCAGTYVVTITDAAAHTLTDSVVIVAEANTIQLTTTTDTSSRCIANGSATVFATGGNGVYSYNWSNGNTTPTISNISLGTFYVTVTSGACTVKDTATISRYPVLTVLSSATNTSCGNTNGSISLTAAGADGYYVYSWSNGDTTSSISNLASGTYSCTISSAQCLSQVSKVISSSTPISPNLSLSFNPTCPSNITSVVSTPYGGGVGPYNFSWSNGSNLSTIYPLSSASYFVSVTNSTCSATDSIVVDLSQALSITPAITHTTCGLNNGAISLIQSRPAALDFSWSNGSVDSLINGLSAGNYSVTVSEGTCTLTTTATVQPSTSTSVFINASATTICEGDSAALCGPSGQQIYLWNTGQTEQCIYVKQTGTYMLTASDVNCSAVSNSLQITVHQTPSIGFTLPDTVCLSDINLLLSGSPTGGSFNGWGVSNDTFYTALATTGFNYISYTYTDTNNCTSIQIDSMWLGSCGDTSCQALFTLHPENTIPSYWYLLNQSTGNNALKFFWEWGDGTTDTGSTVIHEYTIPGYYNICLIVSDTTGCSDTYCDSSTYIFKTDEVITVNVVNELPTTINDIKNILKIALYPNPATDKLTISAGGTAVEKVVFYNIHGQLVSELSSAPNSELNVSQFVSGIYIAEITIRGITKRVRWVKM